MSLPLLSVHPPQLHLVYPFVNRQFCPGYKLRPSQYQEGHNSQVEAKCLPAQFEFITNLHFNK
ncbi:hypothetical protein P691DRAFT_765289 [Macrolepiota fuliginosa MF-IS2]|uniref:Uncharacterized protein n=1 Tax=Macrolepiota fuliginosa MF-IS2 TaxID=1400762 RepID=A0A9P6BY69_9AGAR|nr:hypothetical protein P691DRAFT_765289 [Macrolepiota fuliginosa MF-IS2]